MGGGERLRARTFRLPHRNRRGRPEGYAPAPSASPPGWERRPEASRPHLPPLHRNGRRPVGVAPAPPPPPSEWERRAEGVAPAPSASPSEWERRAEDVAPAPSASPPEWRGRPEASRPRLSPPHRNRRGRPEASRPHLPSPPEWEGAGGRRTAPWLSITVRVGGRASHRARPALHHGAGGREGVPSRASGSPSPVRGRGGGG